MIFHSVYDMGVSQLTVLYKLLEERTPEQSISHKKMPTYAAHCNYVMGRPHIDWQLIQFGGEYIGAIYLSKQNEIGISIFKKYQNQGHGTNALNKFIEKHSDKRLLANINPANTESIHLFEKMGFKIIQNTYERSVL